MFKKIGTALILGDGFYQKIIFVFYLFYFKISHKLKLNRNYCFLLHLKFGKDKFNFYLTHGSDVAVLREIFVRQDYFFDIFNPKIIMDIGGNVGASALYFSIKYPQSLIYVFEPDPESFKKLVLNTKQFKNIKPRNYAISNIDGFMDFFYYPQNSISSSFYRRNNAGIERKTKVSVKTLSSVMKEENIDLIDLLKFDVEGAEFLVFEDYASFDKIKNIIGEVHEDLTSKSVEDFFGLFKNFTKNKTALYKKRFAVRLINKKYV